MCDDSMDDNNQLSLFCLVAVLSVTITTRRRRRRRR